MWVYLVPMTAPAKLVPRSTVVLLSLVVAMVTMRPVYVCVAGYEL